MARKAKAKAKKSTAELLPGRGRYTAIYERDPDGDAWIVRIEGLEQCHSFGRSLGEARRHIQDALTLWVDDAKRAELVDDVRLGSDVQRAVRDLAKAREKAQGAQQELHEQSRSVANALLREHGLSTRDAAELMGISQQRVAQLGGGR